MRTVLVIGADGYLGRHVAAALGGVPGTAVVRGMQRPDRDAVPVDLAAAGIAGLVATLREMRPDVVVNCAGLLAGSRGALADANTGAVAHLLDAIDAGAPTARLVQLGSAAEYGRTRPGTRTSERRVPDPVADYGRTKLAGTLLVRGAQAGGLDAVVLRIFNVVGPAMPEGTVTGAAIRALDRAIATRAGSITLGPLDAVRDFIDVRDVGLAVARAAVQTGPLPQVVNIGTGAGAPVRELVRRLAHAAGFEGRIEERRASGSPRSFDVPWQVADVGLARTRLGWTPAHSLADAADHAWAGSRAP